MGPAALLREEAGLLSQPYWQSHTCHLSQDTTGQGLAHQQRELHLLLGGFVGRCQTGLSEPRLVSPQNPKLKKSQSNNNRYHICKGKEGYFSLTGSSQI